MTPKTLALPPELCAHWERVEEPHGPVSTAKCIKCGRVREYETAYPWKTYNKAALTVRDA